MKFVRLPWGQYTFRHYYWAKVADTTHTGGSKGLHDVQTLCETHYPASHCRCGEYEVHWWL